MGILERTALFACDFRPRVVGGLDVCPNFGLAAGAPRWIQLGDGTTSAKYPTPLVGFGATFDGGDYIQAKFVDRYTGNSPFWMYVFGRFSGTDGSLFVTRDATQPNSRGIGLSLSGGVLVTSIAGASGIDQTRNFTAPKVASSCAVNFNALKSAASSFEYFLDSVSKGNGTVDVDTWTGDTIASGKQLLFGAYWNGSTPTGPAVAGTYYAIAIGDGLLTVADINELTALAKRGIR